MKIIARIRRFFWISWRQAFLCKNNLWSVDFYDKDGRVTWIGVVSKREKQGYIQGISIEQFFEHFEVVKEFWRDNEKAG